MSDQSATEDQRIANLIQVDIATDQNDLHIGNVIEMTTLVCNIHKDASTRRHTALVPVLCADVFLVANRQPQGASLYRRRTGRATADELHTIGIRKLDRIAEREILDIVASARGRSRLGNQSLPASAGEDKVVEMIAAVEAIAVVSSRDLIGPRVSISREIGVGANRVGINDIPAVTTIEVIYTPAAENRIVAGIAVNPVVVVTNTNIITARRTLNRLTADTASNVTLCLKNDVLLAFPPSDLEVLSWQDVTRFPIRVGH